MLQINAAFYNFASDFDKDHPHGPKYTFGMGRDKFTKVYVESNKNLDMNVPGPGKYYNPPAFGKGAISYSFRGRPEPNKEMIEKRKKMYPVPGPGQYKLPSEFGHYESKYAKQVDEELKRVKLSYKSLNKVRGVKGDIPKYTIGFKSLRDRMPQFIKAQKEINDDMKSFFEENTNNIKLYSKSNLLFTEQLKNLINVKIFLYYHKYFCV